MDFASINSLPLLLVIVLNLSLNVFGYCFFSFCISSTTYFDFFDFIFLIICNLLSLSVITNKQLLFPCLFPTTLSISICPNSNLSFACSGLFSMLFPPIFLIVFWLFVFVFFSSFIWQIFCF